MPFGVADAAALVRTGAGTGRAEAVIRPRRTALRLASVVPPHTP
ncbi:hypothetical protein ABZV93_27500 [Actinopolymorpha sp. NPDC004070]